MKQSPITIVINDNSYRLCVTDLAAIRKIPSEDRQHLIALLESVKNEEARSSTAVQDVVNTVLGASADVTTRVGRPADYQAVKPERLGAGDVDALMARLIVEEGRNKKPGLTKQSIFKFAGGIAVVVFLLVVLL
jgi:hypothetical protein